MCESLITSCTLSLRATVDQQHSFVSLFFSCMPNHMYRCVIPLLFSLAQSGERRRVHGDGSGRAVRVVEHHYQRRRPPRLQLRHLQPARAPPPVSIFYFPFSIFFFPFFSFYFLFSFFNFQSSIFNFLFSFFNFQFFYFLRGIFYFLFPIFRFSHFQG